jgi:Secretion system C-terminal sorting domain
VAPANQFTVITQPKTFTQMIADGELLNTTLGGTTPQFLVFCEPVTANLTYTFAAGSELIFLTSQSGITVLPNLTVRFRSSSLHGCQRLWAGVTVKGDGRCVYTSSRVEDAITAVSLEPSSTLWSRATIFNGNYKAMSIGGPGTPNQHSVSVFITESTISGSKPLIEPHLVPGTGCTYTVPNIGISINNVQSVNLGTGLLTSTTPPNEIRDFTSEFVFGSNCNPIGIESINSGLAIRRTRFSNVTSGFFTPVLFDSDPDAPSNLSIRGLGKFGVATFHNTDSGVVGIGNMSIEDCLFSGSLAWSILIGDVSPSGPINPFTIKINNNNFQTVDKDADIFIATALHNVTISNNLFTRNSSVLFPGFFLDARFVNLFNMTPANQNTWILNNDFVTNQTQVADVGQFSAVRSFNINGLVLQENDFLDQNNTSAGTTTGVRIFNGRADFYGNNFTGTGIFNANNILSRGVHLDEAPNCIFNCNTFNNTQVGIFFEGENCDGATLERNNFNNHQTGLELAMDAIIGDQANRHNEWNDATSLREARFVGRDPLNVDDMAFIENSQFKIRHANPSIFWPNPRIIGTTPDPGVWFVPQTGQPGTVDCVLPGFTEPGGGGGFSIAETNTLTGNFKSAKDYPAELYEAEVRLYRKLLNQPQLMTNGSAEQNWYLSKSNTTVGLLATVYQGIINLSVYSPQEKTAMTASTTAYNDILDDILAIDESIYANEENETLVNQLLAQRSVLAVDLAIVIQNHQAVLNPILSSRHTTAQNLASQLNNTVTNTAYETDFKTVLSILLETYLDNGTLSANNQTILEGIAQKCRHEFGIAVVQARASLSEDVQYDDNCPIFSSQRNASSDTELSSVRIAPNPASNQVTVYTGDENFSGELRLINLQGQTIHSWQQQGDRIQLSWNQSLPTGLYFLEVSSNNNFTETLKLIIQ